MYYNFNVSTFNISVQTLEVNTARKPSKLNHKMHKFGLIKKTANVIFSSATGHERLDFVSQHTNAFRIVETMQFVGSSSNHTIPTNLASMRFAQHFVSFLAWIDAYHATQIVNHMISITIEASYWGTTYYLWRLFCTLLISNSLSIPEFVLESNVKVFIRWHIT